MGIRYWPFAVEEKHAPLDPSEAGDERKRDWVIPLIILLSTALVLAVVILLMVYPPWENEPLPQLQTRLRGMDGPSLGVEQLRQEIVKLELENRTNGSLWGAFLYYVPFLKAVVAGAGAFAAIWRQIAEGARQRDLDRTQREADGQRRFNDKEQHDHRTEPGLRQCGAAG